ncbi:MAG: hypothetical protein KC501_07260, partial [Myxococcales bacterium]|nr:hypothetical protein [Myxococcales bacterium]
MIVGASAGTLMVLAHARPGLSLARARRHGVVPAAPPRAARDHDGRGVGASRCAAARATAQPPEQPGRAHASAQLASAERPVARRRPAQLASAERPADRRRPAAGVSGLIKVLLSLQHKQLPPTANFTKL